MSNAPTRRTILKAGAAGLVATSFAGRAFGQSAASDEIKIALIGCGGRGTGAATQALNVPGNKLVAMADAFEDRLNDAASRLEKQGPQKFDVPKERRFIGFDAYKQAIDAADVVILATPPGFRPMQLEYAVSQGKHVFMEKPVAVDSEGVRTVLAAAKEADAKGLKIVCGLQRRYDPKYISTYDEVKKGTAGDIIGGSVYWNSGGVWVKNREPDQTEMEYQMRNWYYFNWLCGDHIMEQHIHNIDVANWYLDSAPTKATGMGGRQVRVGKNFGEIFDHHIVEFEYDNGIIINSFCRHQRNTVSRVSEELIGTKGRIKAGMIRGHDGKGLWRHRGTGGNPYQIEHDQLFAAIRADKPINDAYYTAESTLTSLMGRYATYTGQPVTRDEALNAEVSLMPTTLAWDAEPGPKPGEDGLYPCAIPGVTTLA